MRNNSLWSTTTRFRRFQLCARVCVRDLPQTDTAMLAARHGLCGVAGEAPDSSFRRCSASVSLESWISSYCCDRILPNSNHYHCCVEANEARARTVLYSVVPRVSCRRAH